MSRELHDRWMDELTEEVHAAMVKIDPDGMRKQALGAVLFACSLQIMHEIHGSEAVADHLQSVSERFRSAGGKSFDHIAMLS